MAEKKKRSTAAERGGRSRKGNVKVPHVHNWDNGKTTTTTRRGITYRVTTHKCKNPNCPGPPLKEEEVIARESGSRCSGCGTVFPNKHKYNCKFADDD